MVAVIAFDLRIVIDMSYCLALDSASIQAARNATGSINRDVI